MKKIQFNFISFLLWIFKSHQSFIFYLMEKKNGKTPTSKYVIDCEGGDRKRGGVKISESPVNNSSIENIKNQQLNMNKVQV
jgi:hypothetical protein